jgi:hypothetical protein
LAFFKLLKTNGLTLVIPADYRQLLVFGSAPHKLENALFGASGG